MLFIGDKGECGMIGTKIQLEADLCVLMHAMVEKGIVDKELLLFLAETACKTDEEMQKEAQERIMKHMSEFADDLGSDKAGEILRNLFNIKEGE